MTVCETVSNRKITSYHKGFTASEMRMNFVNCITENDLKVGFMTNKSTTTSKRKKALAICFML
jgi:hypothetical protein